MPGSTLPGYESSHAEWEAFAQRLREFIYQRPQIDLLTKAVPKSAVETREQMFADLREAWFRGGCYVLAKALHDWMGRGRILFVPEDDIGAFRHAFLEVPTKFGPVYIDDTGHAWRKSTTKAGIAWAHRPLWATRVEVTDSVGGDLGGWQAKAAAALTKALRAQFGSWPK